MISTKKSCLFLRKLSFSIISFSVFSFILLFTCCTSSKNIEISEQQLIQSEITECEEEGIALIEPEHVLEESIIEEPAVISSEPLTVLFAGDIMCHSENYSMSNFDDIYSEIKPIVSGTDLSLANIEAPVDDSKPFSTYPNFNMKSVYIQAAIDAGFNVFSLANNHTNDQGLNGIIATYDYFEKKEKELSESARPLYACGIKKQKKDPPLTYRMINVKGWKVLFAAVTELLNSPTSNAYIDYLNPSEETRDVFIKYLVNLRKNNPCDLFILSIHCCEPEYIRTVNKKQNDFYNKLLDNGIDVVWANHPHVAKDWQIIGDEKTGIQNKIIFNALGNTISGQRRNPQFLAPETERDYTGDSYMIKVTFDKNNGLNISKIEPFLITTYITPQWSYVIKLLNDGFIETLENQKRIQWARYLTERKKLMEKLKGIEIWQ